MAAKRELIPVNRIAQSIHLLRGQKVMLDSDLAALYEVPTGHLNRAVKRDFARFPSDLMVRTNRKEVHIPYAFTEQGVAMLSSVLNSPRSGERTRLACWRGRPRHRELILLRNRFSARRRKQHARRVCSPIQTIR
jgi:hypothetical protein